MKCDTVHLALRRSLLLGIAICVLSASGVRAQSAQPEAPSTVEESAQIPTTPLPQAVRPVDSPYWASIGGFEGDSHDTGYAFFGPQYVRPFRPNMAFVAGANLNYLYYEFDTGDGRTNVRSPGVSTKAGVRFGDRNWVQFTAGPSFKRRHREVRDLSDRVVSSSRDLDPGVSLGADVWANPTSRSNIHGMLHHGTEDSYTWSRIAAKQQVTNFDWRNRFTHYLGAEYIGQGNEDIRSNQVGAFVEFLHAPSSISIMLRGGYKHSAFDVGPDKTGPWFAVGFYQRFRR
jgi:hypothetical protein